MLVSDRIKGFLFSDFYKEGEIVFIWKGEIKAGLLDGDLNWKGEGLAYWAACTIG